MTRVLDGYLIGRAHRGTQELRKSFEMRHLSIFRILDGYLLARRLVSAIGPPTAPNPAPNG